MHASSYRILYVSTISFNNEFGKKLLHIVQDLRLFTNNQAH